MSKFTALSPTGVEERIATVGKLLLKAILDLYQKHDGDESVVRSHCLEMAALISDCCDREDPHLKQVLSQGAINPKSLTSKLKSFFPPIMMYYLFKFLFL